MSRLAITGATGFVGGHLLRLALDAGHEVRALTRRGGVPADQLTWVPGALDDAAALAQLCKRVDAVIHVAGLTNAPDLSGFRAGNVAGTAAMLSAAAAAGVTRFVFVSSLSAREPALSNYGESKAEAEALVWAAGLDATIVRPPAIYGPGDRDMLELFRMAKRGIVPLPPRGRLSIIHVEDLCRLLLALIAEDTTFADLIEPDDGLSEGWSHTDLARAIGAAVQHRIVPVPLPRSVLRLGSLIDGLVRRGQARLTADRVRYFCHPDWVVNARPSTRLWQPQVDTREGLRATAEWYCRAGWL